MNKKIKKFEDYNYEPGEYYAAKKGELDPPTAANKTARQLHFNNAQLKLAAVETELLKIPRTDFMEDIVDLIKSTRELMETFRSMTPQFESETVVEAHGDGDISKELANMDSESLSELRDKKQVLLDRLAGQQGKGDNPEHETALQDQIESALDYISVIDHLLGSEEVPNLADFGAKKAA